MKFGLTQELLIVDMKNCKMEIGEFYFNPNTSEIVLVLEKDSWGVKIKVILSDRPYAMGGICGISKDFFENWKKL